MPVADERRRGDVDAGHGAARRCDAGLELAGIGQPVGLQRTVDRRGQFGVAVLLVR